MSRIQSETRYDGAFGNDAILFRYRLHDGRFRLVPAHADFPAVANARFLISYSKDGIEQQLTSDGGMTLVDEHTLDDVHGTGKQYCFDCREAQDLALSLVVNIYERQPFVLLRLLVTHRGQSPVHLHHATLIQAQRGHDSAVEFGDRPRPLAFFDVGWHDWVYTGLRNSHQRAVDTRIGYYVRNVVFNPALPIPRVPGEFWGDGWGILTDHQNAIVTGLVSTADQFGTVHVHTTPRENSLVLTAEADGIQFDPGDTFQSEWGYVQFVGLPNIDPPADYVQAVARQMQARVPASAPAPKWTHWYHHFQYITEEKFIANLEVIDRLRDRLPIETVQLDDGYQAAWGDWETCNDKFPNCLDWLAAQIKARGFSPGLWFAPFALDPKSKLAQAHPDWLVKNKAGKPISAGHIWNYFANALDTTHPDVLSHMQELTHTFAQKWGFAFIKADWCYAAALPGVRHDPKATRAQALRRGLESIRAGLGDEPFLLGCGCPFGPAIGVVDAMRIGPDTSPSWNPLIWNMKWATPLIRDELSMASLRNNIRHTLNLSTLHRNWWWNDPDCLMVRNHETRLNEHEIRSEITLVGMHGGLVVNSDDLTRLDPERIKLIGLLTPILSPGARAIDLLKHEMPEQYEMSMSRPWGDYRVIALFNWSKQPANRTIKPAELGLSENVPLHVFDFWNRTYWRQTSPEIVLHGIPAHGCVVLRIVPDNGQPCLVGGTVHVTQGGEVEAFEVHDGEIEIRVMDLGRAAEGELWVWLPEHPTEATCDGESVALRRINPHVYAIPVACGGGATIRLGKMEPRLPEGFHESG